MNARRALIVTAAALAAVFVWIVGTLPARPATASGPIDEAIRRRTIAGAIHVHSTRSDGSGNRAEIAAAAAAAGLRFVIVTDHGDATRLPDPPAYIHGVLCIDAVEISTSGGHYVALDLPAAPYPLGGEPAAVVEDVARLGGFGIVAHPDSPKVELHWSDWDLPVNGLEWLNVDSEWRDETRVALAGAILHYPFRPAPALASIFDRPVQTLSRWDAIAATRAIVGVAGHDAHGGWGNRLEEGGSRRVPIPSYDASFRTFATRVVLDAEPSGAADRDSRLVIDALRAGRTFTAIDAVAGPAWIDYRADVAGSSLVMGQQAPFAPSARATIRAAVPPGGRITLFRDGKPLAESTSDGLDAPLPGPGAYRVEIAAPGAPGDSPIPWLVTNPIYLLSQPLAAKPPDVAPAIVREISEPGAIEKDTGSTGSVSLLGSRRMVAYKLRDGIRASQYVALSIPLSNLPEFNALAFDARSLVPARVSVQLRFKDAGGARWTHSVFLSPETAHVVFPVARLRPADAPSSPPPFTSASSLLFVVDLTNARPGAEGQFEIWNLALASIAAR